MYAVALGLLVVSCSVDNAEVNNETADLTQQIANDNSSLGIYKGVFSTMNSEERGVVEIRLSNNNFATAIIQMVSGDKEILKSDNKVVAGSGIFELNFSATSVDGISFKFSVGADGSFPTLSDVTYKALASDIMVVKETSRAPVVPVTGTYAIDGGGPSDTFSIIFNTGSGAGNDTDITTMIMRSGFNVGNTTGNSQSACTSNAFSGSCGIAGSTVTLPGGQTVSWTGTHIYDLSGADCSRAGGTWTSTGGPSGTWISDATCSIILDFEDFEDTTTTYVPSVPDDLTDIANRNYFGIIGPFTATPPVDISYMNVQGSGYYGAQDTDSANSGPVSTIELVWTDLPVGNFTNLNVSGSFGEDDATDGNEDWDTTSSVRVEFSFNNTNWMDLIAFESEIGTDGNATNELPRQDTDFDTTGDGAPLVPLLTQYSGMFATGGAATVSIRIVIQDLDTGDEDIAIDNIIISAN